MGTTRKTTPAATPEADEFDFAPAWQPAPDDVIRGKITQLDMGYSEYGNYPIVTLDTADGEQAIHAFHQALRDKLSDLKPEVGMNIAIKYFGEVEAKDGKRKYRKYVVKLDGVTPTGFWDGTRSQPEPADDTDDLPF